MMMIMVVGIPLTCGVASTCTTWVRASLANLILTINLLKYALKANIMSNTGLLLLSSWFLRPSSTESPLACLLNLEYFLVELALLRAKWLRDSVSVVQLSVICERITELSFVSRVVHHYLMVNAAFFFRVIAFCDWVWLISFRLTSRISLALIGRSLAKLRLSCLLLLNQRSASSLISWTVKS